MKEKTYRKVLNLLPIEALRLTAGSYGYGAYHYDPDKDVQDTDEDQFGHGPGWHLHNPDHGYMGHVENPDRIAKTEREALVAALVVDLYADNEPEYAAIWIRTPRDETDGVTVPEDPNEVKHDIGLPPRQLQVLNLVWKFENDRNPICTDHLNMPEVWTLIGKGYIRRVGPNPNGWSENALELTDAGAEALREEL
jgi:hypothetical protein